MYFLTVAHADPHEITKAAFTTAVYCNSDQQCRGKEKQKTSEKAPRLWLEKSKLLVVTVAALSLHVLLEIRHVLLVVAGSTLALACTPVSAKILACQNMALKIY